MGLLVADPAGDPSSQNIIEGEALNATRLWGWISGGIGVVGAAAYALFKDVTNAPSQRTVIIAVSVIVAASLFSGAIAVAADLLARARATASKLSKEAALESIGKWTEALPTLMEGLGKALKADGPATAEVKSATATVAPLAALVGATAEKEGDDKFLVLALRWDPDKKEASYLVARRGGGLEWKSEDDLADIQFPYV